MNKYWMTECRIAQVSVDLSAAGKCDVRIEPVAPYKGNGRDKKDGIIFIGQTAVAYASLVSCINSFPTNGKLSEGNGEIKIYEVDEVNFTVAGCDCYAKAALLVALKTSRQTVRVWVSDSANQIVRVDII